MADADFHEAVYYRLQCISEATRDLLLVDPGITERHAEIPWMRVRAIGNVFRHEYGEIESSWFGQRSPETAFGISESRNLGISRRSRMSSRHRLSHKARCVRGRTTRHDCDLRAGRESVSRRRTS